MSPDSSALSRFTVIAFLYVKDGLSREATREAATLDEALEHVREVEAKFPTWKAITLVHSEDLPKMMEGAERVEGLVRIVTGYRPDYDGCVPCQYGFLQEHPHPWPAIFGGLPLIDGTKFPDDYPDAKRITDAG